jgi:hypothetical protein
MVVAGAIELVDLAGLLREMQRLGALDPALVLSEVRPLVQRLRERERTCDGCGVQYLQRQRHRRERNFHSASCRSHSRQCA